MTLELCNGIIIFEAAAILHDTDTKFAVIDSALSAKKKDKVPMCFLKKLLQYWYLVPSTNGTGNVT